MDQMNGRIVVTVVVTMESLYNYIRIMQFAPMGHSVNHNMCWDKRQKLGFAQIPWPQGEKLCVNVGIWK